jgi:hypothetical protein
MTASNTVKTPMVRNNCPAELRDIVFEVNQVFTLLVRDDIVEVNILVAPLEVMDNALISKLLLDDEKVLEEVYDALVDVEVVELSDHCLLVLEVLFVSVNEGVPLVNY